MSPIPISISKVNQVDAARLDIEMSAMLKEQLVKVFALMKTKPTPGIALMNLRYRDERAMEIPGKSELDWKDPGLTVAQKIWYCVATVGGQYIWTRLQSFSAFRRWGDSEQVLVFRNSPTPTMWTTFLLCWYRNLVERVLRARLVYGSPNMNRAVSFEYMNRQLVWNEFSEMLLLLLPLLNSSSVRNFLFVHFPRRSPQAQAEDDSACPICLASPTIPFLAFACQHRFNWGEMEITYY
ncbi:Peroxisome biogenesis protein 2, partial [Cucurbita argyrosperma subsp. sororia]